MGAGGEGEGDDEVLRIEVPALHGDVMDALLVQLTRAAGVPVAEIASSPASILKGRQGVAPDIPPPSLL